MTIGQTLKQWREAAKKTQRQAAAAIGKQHPIIHHYEKDKYEIPTKELALLQKYYRVKKSSWIVKLPLELYD